MAYSKENKLKRIIDVQACFHEHYKPGMTIEYVYQNHIYPAFKISRSNFYGMMKVPAAKELKLLQDAKQSKTGAKQISMDIPDTDISEGCGTAPN